MTFTDQIRWEAVAAIASTVIALCALALSIWQGYLSRKHNRISVRPHLTMWNHKYHNDGLYAADIVNNGIGPAIIKCFSIKLDGKKIEGKETEPMVKLLQTLLKGFEYDSRQSFLSPGYAMAANETRQLVKIRFKGEKKPSPIFIEESFKKADIYIEYESMYGEKFWLSSEKQRAERNQIVEK